ncbi:MAG: iron chelate uptake ABC transporter family permease subunit, partial [Bacilli bacterium]
ENITTIYNVKDIRIGSDGKTIEYAVIDDKKYVADFYIDCTQDADITVLAGGEYVIGWEDINEENRSMSATLVIAIFYATGIAINTKNVMIASFIGALITGIIVLGFISKKANNNSIAKILLAGTAMSTFFISLTTIIGLLSNQSQMIGFWVSGGFRNASWADFKLVFFVGIIGLIIAILLSPKINILNLGDDVAIGLGEKPEKIRFTTLMVMIPMCAAAVAVGKNIAFVGLIVPQIVRKILGEDYRRNIPCSFLLGAVLLTYADIAARMLFDPYETPIGVFTALIGIPFFIAVARKERG